MGRWGPCLFRLPAAMRWRNGQRTEPRDLRAILACLALLGLAACETAKGAGRDIETAGHVITKTVKDIEKKF